MRTVAEDAAARRRTALVIAAVTLFAFILVTQMAAVGRDYAVQRTSTADVAISGSAGD